MPDLLVYLFCYFVFIEVLYTFLIALIPYNRRCQRLVKVKTLGPQLHHRIIKNAFNINNIGLNALQEDAPISATASTTV